MPHLRKVEEWLTARINALPAVKKGVRSVDNQRAQSETPYPRLVFRLQPNQRVETNLDASVASIRANYEVVVIASNCGFDALADIDTALHGLLDRAIVRASPACPSFNSTLQTEVRREYADKVDANASLFEVGGLFSFFVTP